MTVGILNPFINTLVGVSSIKCRTTPATITCPTRIQLFGRFIGNGNGSFVAAIEGAAVIVVELVLFVDYITGHQS